jgi:hypothetical protein
MNPGRDRDHDRTRKACCRWGRGAEVMARTGTAGGGVQTVPPIFRIHLVVLNIMDEGGDKFCGNQIKDEARGIGDW